MTTTRETLLREIEAYLARSEMGAAEFGKRTMKDPSFVGRLRNGVNPGGKTIDKVRLWMREHPLDRKRKKAAEQRSAAY